MSNSDAWLLRRYVEQQDEAAFAELVPHNLPLVYRCACRLLSGDAARAEDVAQEVFADLARKARSLTRHPALAAWLHTTTRYAAARARRGVGSTAAALGMALSGQGSLAVPAGLAASVTQGALASAAAAGATGLLAAWLGTGAGKLVAVGSLAGLVGVGGIYLVAVGHGAVGQGPPPFAAGVVAGGNPVPAADPWPSLLGAWDRADARARSRLLLAVPADELGQCLLRLWRENTPEGRARFQAIFDHWCVAASEPAAKWAAATWDEITGEDGVKLREQAGLAWAARAMKPAYEWALTLRDAAEEAGLAARMLRQLARTQPQVAIALAKETSVVFYETTRFVILEGWWELNPTDAFATLGDECIHHKRMPDLLGKWSGADVKTFMRWGFEGTLIMSERDPADRDRKRLRAAASDAALDRLNSPHRFVPALFAELLSDPVEDPDRPNAVEELRIICSRRFTTWLNKDPEAALEWLLSLPTEATSTQKFISKWGICDQGDSGGQRSHAAEIGALRKLPDSPARNAGLESHIHAWARQDLDGSLAWARATGDQKLINLAYQGAILSVASEAPDQAVALYSSLPDGPAKTAMALELSAAWAVADPEAAIRWLDGARPGWPQAALEHAEPARTPLANWAAARPAEYVAWLDVHAPDKVQSLKSVLRISMHLRRSKRSEVAALQAAYRAGKSPMELQTAAIAWLKTAKDQAARDEITSAILLNDLFSGAEKSRILSQGTRPAN